MRRALAGALLFGSAFVLMGAFALVVTASMLGAGQQGKAREDYDR